MKGNEKSVDPYGNITANSLGNYIYSSIINLPPDKRPNQKPITKSASSRDIVLAHHDKFKRRKIRTVIPSETDAVYPILEEAHNYFLKKEYDKAIEYYDNAISINPKDSNIWDNKGNALYELGRYEEAIKCYERAIIINPNDFYARGQRDAALKMSEQRSTNNSLSPNTVNPPKVKGDISILRYASAGVTGIAGLLFVINSVYMIASEGFSIFMPFYYYGVNSGYVLFAVLGSIVAGLAQIVWVLPILKQLRATWYYVGIANFVVTIILPFLTLTFFERVPRENITYEIILLVVFMLLFAYIKSKGVLDTVPSQERLGHLNFFKKK